MKRRHRKHCQMGANIAPDKTEINKIQLIKGKYKKQPETNKKENTTPTKKYDTEQSTEEKVVFEITHTVLKFESIKREMNVDKDAAN